MSYILGCGMPDPKEGTNYALFSQPMRDGRPEGQSRVLPLTSRETPTVFFVPPNSMCVFPDVDRGQSFACMYTVQLQRVRYEYHGFGKGSTHVAWRPVQSRFGNGLALQIEEHCYTPLLVEGDDEDGSARESDDPWHTLLSIPDMNRLHAGRKPPVLDWLFWKPHHSPTYSPDQWHELSVVDGKVLVADVILEGITVVTDGRSDTSKRHALPQTNVLSAFWMP